VLDKEGVLSLFFPPCFLLPSTPLLLTLSPLWFFLSPSRGEVVSIFVRREKTPLSVFVFVVFPPPKIRVLNGAHVIHRLPFDLLFDAVERGEEEERIPEAQV
jgi:hypothetical protein